MFARRHARDARLPLRACTPPSGRSAARRRSRRSARCTSRAPRSVRPRRRPAVSARSKPCSSPGSSASASTRRSRCRRCCCSGCARSGSRSFPVGLSFTALGRRRDDLSRRWRDRTRRCTGARHLVDRCAGAAARVLRRVSSIVDPTTRCRSRWELDLTDVDQRRAGVDRARALADHAARHGVGTDRDRRRRRRTCTGRAGALAVVVSGVARVVPREVRQGHRGAGSSAALHPDINVREGNGTGLGFVSGHTAVAFADRHGAPADPAAEGPGRRLCARDDGRPGAHRVRRAPRRST